MPVAVFNVQVRVYVHPATYVYLLGDCKEHTSVSFVLLWPGHVSILPNIDIQTFQVSSVIEEEEG